MGANSIRHRLPATPAHIHVAGIGGVGMNAIAQVLCAQGYEVSGSDRMIDQGLTTPVLEKLAKSGITLRSQDGSGITETTAALVVSTAIEADNPDLTAAHARKVPVLHRAAALAAAIRDDSCIAIAGTSGKTTVTGMTGWLLTELGLRPNVVNGGALLNWQDESTIGNVRITGSNWWVVELDESDRSLMNFHPDWVLLTNISRDHFDLEETRQLFSAFCTQAKMGIVSDANTLHQLPKQDSWQAKLYSRDPAVSTSFALPLIGEHNRLNAELAISFCEAFGYDRGDAIRALQSFQGIERRLQRVSSPDSIAVYDEYAHNPAKIAAAWEAVAWTAERVRGVWRPHGFGPLAAMADDLKEMFAKTIRSQDQLCILPVYYAGGTTKASFSAADFVERLNARGVAAIHVPDYQTLYKTFLSDVRPTDAFLFMGARDPELPIAARHLAERLHCQIRSG